LTLSAEAGRLQEVEEFSKCNNFRKYIWLIFKSERGDFTAISTKH